MLRYNIFNLIHKALRTLLYQTAQSLQQTNFTDMAEAAETFEKVNIVIGAFEQHGHHEDSILMPIIEKFQRETIASFEKDHIDDRQMGNALKHLQNIYHAAQTDLEHQIAGSAFVKAFGDYLVFNLQHMQREEIELNKLLWENYTDDEIQKIDAQIVANIPPEAMATAAQWIMQAINCNEAIQWLKQIKANAPEPVFAALFQFTETHLPERFREIVQDAVLSQTTAEPVY